VQPKQPEIQRRAGTDERGWKAAGVWAEHEWIIDGWPPTLRRGRGAGHETKVVQKERRASWIRAFVCVIAEALGRVDVLRKSRICELERTSLSVRCERECEVLGGEREWRYLCREEVP
jgi:hypothetical protein